MQPMSQCIYNRHLMDARYVRWQGIAMAQFTIAIALLSALSVSMLGASLVLILHEKFPSPGAHGLALGLSMLLLMAVVLLCLFATVSRTLDFRLTARKVRGKRCLLMFGISSEQFGRISWLCFWTAILLFLGGGLLFATSCGLLLLPKLLCGT